MALLLINRQTLVQCTVQFSVLFRSSRLLHSFDWFSLAIPNWYSVLHYYRHEVQKHILTHYCTVWFCGFDWTRASVDLLFYCQSVFKRGRTVVSTSIMLLINRHSLMALQVVCCACVSICADVPVYLCKFWWGNKSVVSVCPYVCQVVSWLRHWSNTPSGENNNDEF